MPMRRRDLTRQHKLHTGVEIGGDLRLAAEPGIFKYKNTTFGFLCRNQSPRLQHRRANVAEVPACRLALTARFRRDEISKRKPQRRQVLSADPVVEGLTLRRVYRRLRDGNSLHDVSSRQIIPNHSPIQSRRCRFVVEGEVCRWHRPPNIKSVVSGMIARLPIVIDRDVVDIGGIL